MWTVDVSQKGAGGVYWKWVAVNNAGLEMPTGITVCGGEGHKLLQALKEHFVRWLAPTFSALWNWGKEGEEAGGRNVILTQSL